MLYQHCVGSFARELSFMQAAASVKMGSKPPFAAHFINDCNWYKWTSQRSILSIEKSYFRGEMRLPYSPCPFPGSLVFFPCSGIDFPCSLINRETACKALLLWYDSDPNQSKTVNIDPKRTFFPVNSLLTGKIQREWLARDCLHYQIINFAFIFIYLNAKFPMKNRLGTPTSRDRQGRSPPEKPIIASRLS